MQTLISEGNKNSVSLTILEALLGSEARTKVLLVLFTNIGRTFYQRQVENATKLPLRAVQRELERLVQIGLLYQWKEGNRTWYQVDQNHPLVPILQSLILKVCSPIDRVRTILSGNKSIRLSLYHPLQNKILLVTTHSDTFPETIEGIPLIVYISNEFIEKMEKKDPEFIAFLQDTVDLLGNREDVLWRVIENNKLNIPKGENVL